MIDVAITGAAGRMGQRLIALARQDSEFNLVAAIERPDHAAQSKDAGEVSGIGAIGVPITPDLRPTPRVLIDFTSPGSMRPSSLARDGRTRSIGRGVALIRGA